jgi:NaMN:DMB phosphoribosyltransferase
VQPTADQPTSTLAGPDIDIRPGIQLPLPDDAAAAAARDRLSAVDIGVSAPTLAALGMLAEAVIFMAAVQSTPYPRPVLSTRVVLLTGSHAGGVVAGPAPDPRNATPLQHLAINAGAGIVTLEWQPAAAPIELEDAVTVEQMDASLRAGWAEAERAADEGIEMLVLAAGGAGAAVTAAAVVAAITGAEPTMLLTRVVTPAGLYDDNAWMTRCLALRDALHRVRQRDGDPRTVLAALGGADIAAATGLILGAAARRTPIMIDGPVGAAAALLANDFSPQSRSWIVLPDTGRHPAVRLATDSLQLRPWLDLCLDLGEGAASLYALPLMQTALTLAGAGEEVEPQPLTRFDSTGNQIFVGVARPVDPSEEEPEDKAFTGTTVETAPVTYASAHATGAPAAALSLADSMSEPVKDPLSKAMSKGADKPAVRAVPPAAESAPAKPDAAPAPGQKVDTAKADTAKADTAKADTAKTDTAKTDTAKTDAAKTDTAKTDTAKADAPKADAAKAAAPKADTAKADTAKADAAKADAPKASAPRPDSAKPDVAKPDDAKPAPPEGKPAPPEGTKSEGAGDGAKLDAAKPNDAKPGVTAPTRTATKPPPAKTTAKPAAALTGRTGAAKTVAPKAAKAAPPVAAPRVPAKEGTVGADGETTRRDLPPAKTSAARDTSPTAESPAVREAATVKDGPTKETPAVPDHNANGATGGPANTEAPADSTEAVGAASASPPRPRKRP